MHTWLKNRKQKVQITNNWASTRIYRLNAFRYSSIDDLVLIIQYSVLSNYDDDNNLFVMGKTKEAIKSLLLFDFDM